MSANTTKIGPENERIYQILIFPMLWVTADVVRFVLKSLDGCWLEAVRWSRRRLWSLVIAQLEDMCVTRIYLILLQYYVFSVWFDWFIRQQRRGTNGLVFLLCKVDIYFYLLFCGHGYKEHHEMKELVLRLHEVDMYLFFNGLMHKELRWTWGSATTM